MIIFAIIDSDGQLDGVYSSYEKATMHINQKKHPEEYSIQATILDCAD